MRIPLSTNPTGFPMTPPAAPVAGPTIGTTASLPRRILNSMTGRMTGLWATSSPVPSTDVRPGRSLTTKYGIGAGGTGAVYEAELYDNGITSPCAVKFEILPESMRNEAWRQVEEARLMALVNHPHIPSILSTFEYSGNVAIVSELVRGVNLRDWDQTISTSPKAIAEVGVQTADALHYLHNKLAGEVSTTDSNKSEEPVARIIHRDIKPANIMVTAHGHVKLVDFGIAKANFGRGDQTEAGMLAGTAAYLPPERFDGVDSPKGDVFSLGIVMLELLLGINIYDHLPNIDGRRYFPYEEKSFNKRKKMILDLVKSRTRANDSKEEAKRALRRRLKKRTTAMDAPDSYADVNNLVLLIDRMLSFHPEERPSAKEVRDQLKLMVASLRGSDLQNLAEVSIPSILAEKISQNESNPDKFPLVGQSISIDHSLNVELPTHRLSTSGKPRQIFALTGAMALAGSSVFAFAVATVGLSYAVYAVGPIRGDHFEMTFLDESRIEDTAENREAKSGETLAIDNFIDLKNDSSPAFEEGADTDTEFDTDYDTEYDTDFDSQEIATAVLGGQPIGSTAVQSGGDAIAPAPAVSVTSAPRPVSRAQVVAPAPLAAMADSEQDNTDEEQVLEVGDGSANPPEWVRIKFGGVLLASGINTTGTIYLHGINQGEATAENPHEITWRVSDERQIIPLTILRDGEEHHHRLRISSDGRWRIY